jgi:photosystem II stability/assembly factor-like uncharacterized protein
MKIFLFIFPALFLFLNASEAQQWNVVNPAGYENSFFNCGWFINENEGWVFTEPQSWDNIELLHTSDGALTFERLLVLPYDYDCYRMQMLDSLYGYDKIENSPAHENYFWKTTDGGRHWLDITDTALFNYGNPLYSHNIFYFVNRDTGFFGGNSAIYKTEDAGSSWNKMNTPTMIDSFPCFFSPHSIYFSDEQHGWAACSLFIDAGIGMKTVDGGQNWSFCTPVTGDLFSVHFADSLNGGMVGSGSFSMQVLGTEDNFNSVSYFYSAWNQWPGVIACQNDSTVWVSGTPPIFNRSTDHGQTFTVYDSGFAASNPSGFVQNIQFFGHTGYALAYSAILKLIDTLTTARAEGIPGDYALRLSPNPVIDKCELSVSVSQPGRTALEVYSPEGVFLRKSENDLSPGKNTVILDVHTLKPGIYLLRFCSPMLTRSVKMIKQ